MNRAPICGDWNKPRWHGPDYVGAATRIVAAGILVKGAHDIRKLGGDPMKLDVDAIWNVAMAAVDVACFGWFMPEWRNGDGSEPEDE